MCFYLTRSELLRGARHGEWPGVRRDRATPHRARGVRGRDAAPDARDGRGRLVVLGLRASSPSEPGLVVDVAPQPRGGRWVWSGTTWPSKSWGVAVAPRRTRSRASAGSRRCGGWMGTGVVASALHVGPRRGCRPRRPSSTSVRAPGTRSTSASGSPRLRHCRGSARPAAPDTATTSACGSASPTSSAARMTMRARHEQRGPRLPRACARASRARRPGRSPRTDLMYAEMWS